MFRPSEDDFMCAGVHSDEPMQRVDHKAKKFGRPRARRNEKVGGGYFVFKRGRRTGRIKTGHILAGKMPFEHPDLESATNEAARLAVEHGGHYSVFAEVRGADLGAPNTECRTNA